MIYTKWCGWNEHIFFILYVNEKKNVVLYERIGNEN